MSELDDVLAALDVVRNYILGKKGVVEAQAAPVVHKPAPEPRRQASPDEIMKLKLMLEGKDWPYAVNPSLICDRSQEDDKLQRAEGILDFVMDQPVSGKKFLDFGCGEGHTIQVASEQGSDVAVGYDIVRPPETSFVWEKREDNRLLTTDLGEVKAAGPYDLILLYDVIDHSNERSPDHMTDPMSAMVEVMQRVRSVCARNATVYLRGHPWIGRHGGHMYEQINKAFVHVVFTPEELADMGYTVPKVQKVVRPISTYRSLFESQGFVVVSEKIERQSVEAFFEKPLIRDRIMASLSSEDRDAIGGKFPRIQMEQCSIDYILKPK